MNYIKINHIKYVDDILLLDNNEEELNKLYVVFSNTSKKQKRQIFALS